MAGTPEDIFFGEGVFVIGQASGGYRVGYELVEDIRAEEWAVAVSPEVYAFIALDGRAVVVRGVEADSFLSLEGTESELDLSGDFFLVGRRLADDLKVRPGDNLFLPGSVGPLLMEATVDDILDVSGAPADEILTDLPRARLLAGLGPETINLVRVRVEDGQELLDYLVASEAQVVVGDGEANVRVEEGMIVDDRIGALLLTRPELGRELGRGYISTFAQYSGNSLRVLVLGMELLTFTLFAMIFAASLVRFLVENRRNVGLVVAIGGGFRALLSTYGRRILGPGLLAGVSGLLLGVGIGMLLEASGTFALFGHVLRYGLDAWQGVLLFLMYVATLLSVLLLSLLFLLNQRPRDLLYEVTDRRFEEVEAG